MQVPGSANALMLGGAKDYTIARSLRFRSSASAYLSRTFSSTPQTYTYSTWIKRGTLGTQQNIAASRSGTASYLAFNTSNQIYCGLNDVTIFTSTAVFRDTSAWYHVVLKVTQSGAVVCYVNNQQVASGTVGASSFLFNSSYTNTIGQYGNFNGFYFDGYMAETHFIDGQALTPSSFGETDLTTGVWKPKKYAGTYGTNGFYLPFSDNSAATAAAIGKDYSGNGNNWTPNNISVTSGATYDSMTDVPTLTSKDAANYCTLNPLDYSQSGTITLTNGNLTASGSGAAYGFFRSTLACDFKIYYEVYCNAGVASNGTYIGFAISTGNAITSAGVCYYNAADGKIYLNGTVVATYATFTNGDVIGVTYDPSTGSASFYKNNTLQGSITTGFTGSVFAAVGDGSSGTVTLDANFGQRPFAYTPPTGFVALNTFNLPEPTIKKPVSNFDVTTYTGNGGTNTITNAAGFSPDLVWLKSRSAVGTHCLFDTIRGVTNLLQSNATAAEVSGSDSLTAFNSNGFTLGADAVTRAGINGSGVSHVAWQWDAGSGVVTNTAGSISAQVRANPSAGFSVVTYTGTGANATVGHGLGVAPKMMIVKNRSAGSADAWAVYHQSLSSTPGNDYLFLNTNNAKSSSVVVWNNTAPTGSVLSVGTDNVVNGSTKSYVAYCFSEVAGYSKFGSYVGNGSADGTFVHLGFKAKWFLLKEINATTGRNSWFIIDSARNTYNVLNSRLGTNLIDAEASDIGIADFVSNGVKIRNSNWGWNESGATYVYAAFAENPFKYSLAR